MVSVFMGRRGLGLVGDGSGGFDGWAHFFPSRAFSRAGQDVEVEKVHHSQNQHHHAELAAACLEDALGAHDIEVEFHVESHETDIDEVKAHDQQMVDTIGELFVAVEAVHEENATTLVQRACDPDGERNGNAEIDAVGDDGLRDGIVHGVWFFLVLSVVSFVFFFSVINENTYQKNEASAE